MRQAEDFTDRFTFNDLTNVTGNQVLSDIYPPLIRRSSWVILGYSTVRLDQAVVDYAGQLITYKYPTQVLQDSKNLVFNDGGAEIYK